MDPSELREGVAIEVDGQPWLFHSMEFIKSSKGQGLYKVQVDNLVTGGRIERTFRQGETLVRAPLDIQCVTFLRADDLLHFEGPSATPYALEPGQVDPLVGWLSAGSQWRLVFFRGRALRVLPNGLVHLRVTACEPSEGGGVEKQVTLETGLVVKVPAFIRVGDLLRFDPARGSYVERVNTRTVG